MKKIAVLFTLFLGVGSQITLYSQSAVEISGAIKSEQGAIPGANIDFLDLRDDFISDCISGSNGKFRSEIKFTIAKTIKIRVNKDGYETLVKNVKIGKTGDVGEFLLKHKKLAISGFVKDSITEEPLQGVEIFFYDQSKLIQSKSTNSMEYFDLETDFIYGQKITVRVSKKDYYPKEQTLTITSDGMNKLSDILLPEIAVRGLRAFIRVKDKKTDKALDGATLRYYDNRKTTNIDTLVPSNGGAAVKTFPKTRLNSRFAD